jgi:hypothetical protein
MFLILLLTLMVQISFAPPPHHHHLLPPGLPSKTQMIHGPILWAHMLSQSLAPMAGILNAVESPFLLIDLVLTHLQLNPRRLCSNLAFFVQIISLRTT